MIDKHFVQLGLGQTEFSFIATTVTPYEFGVANGFNRSGLETSVSLQSDLDPNVGSLSGTGVANQTFPWGRSVAPAQQEEAPRLLSQVQ